MGRTKATDYSKLVIYKIKCNDESVTEFYVGHTTNFSKRKCNHKSNVENGDKKKIYETIRANGGWSNWTMVEVEVYPCNSSADARIREEHWRVELQASLNQRRAYCSEENKAYQAQYYQENADKLKAREAQYYQDHKDEIKAKKSVKYECECGSICQKNGKAEHERSLKHQTFKKNKN